ncbi:hypothetical protein [Chryseobacterium wanjuense]
MVSIMATENNTIVTINNIDSGTQFINGANATPLTGTTFTRTLQKGQSFILYAKVRLNALSLQDRGWLGARITADKNIAVTVGGLMQQGGATSGTVSDNRDFAVDQLNFRRTVRKRICSHARKRGNSGKSDCGCYTSQYNDQYEWKCHP